MARNVEFRAQGHKTLVFSFDDGCQSERLCHDPSLQQFTWPQRRQQFLVVCSEKAGGCQCGHHRPRNSSWFLMVSAAATRHPRGVNFVEVPDIERAERRAVTRSQMEVVFILPRRARRWPTSVRQWTFCGGEWTRAYC